MVVPLEKQGEQLNPGPEEIVVQAGADLIDFDVTPDGERLLVLRERAHARQNEWKVITRWERLLDR